MGPEILHQLRLVDYPQYLQGFSTIQGGAGFRPSTVVSNFFFIFYPYLGEMIRFDEHFFVWNGLKPTSCRDFMVW